jgi:sulfide-dependent adenosine diphosphate thiazole synthase
MDPYKITRTREADITRSIAREFFAQFDQLIQSDVIIIGAGPSGLLCARDVAAAGKRVLIVEESNPLGGGFWNGAYLMNKATIAHPAQEILLKLGVPCKEVGTGLYIVDAPHAIAKIIGATFDSGAKVLNLTKVVDLVIREENRVEGVVVNWSPLEEVGHHAAHVDPIALESKIVVDATGHDAVAVQILSRRGLHPPVPGNGAMWVEKSEEAVIEKTGEIYPNLFLAGLSVAAVYGSPRMGPAFGSMLLSGRKAAELILKKLK